MMPKSLSVSVSICSFSFFLGREKTLMFFEGCPHHLGCAVVLRGGSAAELAKVILEQGHVGFLCQSFRSRIYFNKNADFLVPLPSTLLMEAVLLLETAPFQGI